MTESPLLYSLADPIATLTLHRPEARNALNADLLRALLEGLLRADADDAARAIVLTGAGPTFCAGGDFASMQREAGSLEAHYARQQYADLFRAIARLRKPILAAVNGHAVGGGVGLVCACDLAIAVESAQFGTPETSVGLFPMMVTALLMRNVGRKAALEMMLLGERIGARRAEEIGLINRAVPEAEFESTVRAWAERLARLSPVSTRLGREAIRAQDGMGLDDALTYLNAMLTLNLSTEDAQAGIRTFLEKRGQRGK
jgi:enoyl-CoA hydratase/carnithine racemase